MSLLSLSLEELGRLEVNVRLPNTTEAPSIDLQTLSSTPAEVLSTSCSAPLGNELPPFLVHFELCDDGHGTILRVFSSTVEEAKSILCTSHVDQQGIHDRSQSPASSSFMQAGESWPQWRPSSRVQDVIDSGLDDLLRNHSPLTSDDLASGTLQNQSMSSWMLDHGVSPPSGTDLCFLVDEDPESSLVTLPAVEENFLSRLLGVVGDSMASDAESLGCATYTPPGNFQCSTAELDIISANSVVFVPPYVDSAELESASSPSCYLPAPTISSSFLPSSDASLALPRVAHPSLHGGHISSPETSDMMPTPTAPSSPPSTTIFDQKRRDHSDSPIHKNDTSRRRFACFVPGCTRRFTSQYTLKVHVEAHKPKPRTCFPCTLGCSETFSRQHDRLRHEVAKHGKVCDWLCRDCGRFFSSQKTLGNHKCPCAPGGTRWVMESHTLVNS